MTMTRSPRRSFSLTLALALLAPTSLALAANGSSEDNDWPQWRGPQRTGVSGEAGWSHKAKPEPLWSKQIGLGHSSFAVVDGQVFTLGYDAEQGLDSVLCLDAESGAEIWRHSYPAEIWDIAQDGGTLTTPTIVGDVVYTSNREAKVFCLDRATGAVRWERDLRADMELEPPTWGFSASPLVIDERVLLNMDRVIALDRHTGELVWSTEQGYGNAYSTPTAFTLDGEDYLAVLSGTGLALLKRADGAQSDFYPWSKNPEIYPMSPVVIGERIFISGGYDRGGAMLKVEDGKLVELWGSRVMRNKMSGCVLWQDHLFGFDESILKCIGLDGKERWRKRGMGTGSMSIAGGRLVVLDGHGQVVIAEANPEEYVELSAQPALDGGTSWSTPVLSAGRVYCRSSLGQMTCLDFRSAAHGVADGAVVAEADPRAELPSPDAIVARHMEAVGGSAAHEAVRSLRLQGSSESLINTVRTGDVELCWDRELGFIWSDGPDTQFGYNDQGAWTLMPRTRPKLLEGEEFEARRLVGDLARLFDPARGFAALETEEVKVFEGRDCYAVGATTAGGAARTLFFDVASGFYLGYQGEDIQLWTVSDYREFDGVRIPTEWSTYEPRNGERISAKFDRVSVNPELGPENFTAPEVIQLFMRTPEEVERDTLRLEERHGDLLGDWILEEEPEAPRTFLIEDGFLTLVEADRPPSRMGVANDEGVFAILGVSFVTFTPIRSADGTLEAIQVHVRGEEAERLVRGKQR